MRRKTKLLQQSTLIEGRGVTYVCYKDDVLRAEDYRFKIRGGDGAGRRCRLSSGLIVSIPAGTRRDYVVKRFKRIMKLLEDV